jgi:hypothetical protein
MCSFVPILYCLGVSKVQKLGAHPLLKTKLNINWGEFDQSILYVSCKYHNKTPLVQLIDTNKKVSF